MASPAWLHKKLFIPGIILIICQTMNDLALQILQEALRSALIEAVNNFTSLLHAQVFPCVCLSLRSKFCYNSKFHYKQSSTHSEEAEHQALLWKRDAVSGVFFFLSHGCAWI